MVLYFSPLPKTNAYIRGIILASSPTPLLILMPPQVFRSEIRQSRRNIIFTKECSFPSTIPPIPSHPTTLRCPFFDFGLRNDLQLASFHVYTRVFWCLCQVQKALLAFCNCPFTRFLQKVNKTFRFRNLKLLFC